MRKLTMLALAAGAAALMVGGVQAANAADMVAPQAEGPAPGYAPPPVAGTYAPAPPPAVYGYPPPVAYYPAYEPAYVVAPGPYYERWGYWHGYAPRFAYGYGHWGYGWRR
jgi:hypothetical protein